VRVLCQSSTCQAPVLFIKKFVTLLEYFAENKFYIRYVELIIREYSVDVGVVAVNKVADGKKTQSLHEIDFVVNKGSQKVYIQSALNLDTPEKKEQELTSLFHAKDFFRKIVILEGNQKVSIDETGIIYVGVIPFLLDVSFLDAYL